MGRLFWKFFIFIWFAQLTAIWGIGGAIWLMHHNEDRRQVMIDNSPPAAFIVKSAAATLQYGGLNALKGLLETDIPHPVYAVNEDGHDILGRQISPETVQKAKLVLKDDATCRTVQQITMSGHSYLLFVAEKEHSHDVPPPGHPGPEGHNPNHSPPEHLFPIFPVIAATIASLIFASLLAWNFSKPIQNLRSAFESVAAGKFDINLSSTMGKRRDDLADLGRDFDRMASQIHALMEGQQRLLHDISHEMRSPLARLQVAIGLARQQPEKLESSMERIERESMRMDKLVGELLTLSKLEAGVTIPMQEAINFHDLLVNIVDDAHFEAKAYGKEVELTGQFNSTIQGNAELLHRAIENIIRNAIKYTPDGSSVKIEASLDALQHLQRIAIIDEGAGVPETELELIFKPFYRGGAHNETDGHGLGLAIARRIIEAHGGSIHATNSIAGGLRVEMTLPITV